jgi:hypothetical protein
MTQSIRTLEGYGKAAVRAAGRIWLPALLAGIALCAGCYDQEGGWSRSDWVPPEVPRGLASVTGDEAVTLHWLANTESDLAGYRIYRSTEPRGDYHRIGVVGPETEQYVDRRVENGVTYDYAISAFDWGGNESELSRESVYDTPRPAGRDLVLSNGHVDPQDAGYDFSAYRLVELHDPEADIYYWQTDETGAWMVATERTPDAYTDIQDAGFLPLDAVDFAPTQGWSSTGEVLLTVGHSYVVWTWDNHFAKFRVVEIGPGQVVLDWAYQIDRGNRELSASVPPARTHVPGGGLRIHRAGMNRR